MVMNGSGWRGYQLPIVPYVFHPLPRNFCCTVLYEIMQGYHQNLRGSETTAFRPSDPVVVSALDKLNTLCEVETY